MSRRRFFRLESKKQPLLSRLDFAKRLGRSLAIATLFIGVSLLAGMAGYHYLEDMPWIDAFANAAMILSGMGPLGPLQTWSGKLFAGLYALYSGLALIAATTVVVAPIAHRILHRFHGEVDDDEHRWRDG